MTPKEIADLTDSEANQRLHESKLVNLCWHKGNGYFVCPKCNEEYTPSCGLDLDGHLMPEDNIDYSNDWNAIIPVVRDLNELDGQEIIEFKLKLEDIIGPFEMYYLLEHQRDIVNALLALCEDGNETNGCKHTASDRDYPSVEEGT